MSRVIHELAGWVTANISGFERPINRAIGLTRDLGTTWGKAARDVTVAGAKITAGVTALATGAIFVGRKFAAAAETQTEALRKMEAVLKATGNAAGLTVDQIARFASARQKITNFGDEVTVAGAAVLATFKSIRGDAFLRTMTVAQDMTALFGQDLQSSILQVGKALEDPAVGLTALRRVGVSFTEAQVDQIKALVESNRLLEAQDLILGAIEGQVGGTAEAVARPWMQFLNVLSDIQENIGSVLVPGFDALAKILTGLVQPIADNVGGFEALGQRFGEFVTDHREQIVNAVQQIGEFFVQLWDTASAAGPTLLKVAQGFGDLLIPILRIVAESPALLGLFAIFKAASMLGVTQAVMSLGGAFLAAGKAMAGLASGALPLIVAQLAAFGSLLATKVIPNVLAYTTSLAGLKAIGAALWGPAGVFVIAGAVMFAAADALGVFGQKASSAADQMALLNKQVDQNISLMRKQQQSGLDAADKLEGEARLAALEKQLEQARRRASVANDVFMGGQVRQQQLEREGLGTRVLGGFLGGPDEQARRAEFEHLQSVLPEDKRLADEAAALVEELEKRLQEARESLGEAPKSTPTGTGSGPRPGSQLAAPDFDAAVAAGIKAAEDKAFKDRVQAEVDRRTGESDAKLRKEIEDDLKRAQADRIEQADEAAGAADIREFIGRNGVTMSDVETFAGRLEGVSPELAQRFAADVGFAKPEELDKLAVALANFINRSKAATEAAEGFNQKLGDIDFDFVPVEHIQDFRSRFGELQEQLMNGGLTIDQFKDRVKGLETAAGESFKFHEQLSNLDGLATPEQMTGFTTSFEQLQQSFLNGEMSAAAFGHSLENLRTNMEATAGFNTHLNELATKIPAATGTLFGFQKRFAELQEQFDSGAINAGQFSRAVKDLTDASTKAAEAARREALLKGDFRGAGLDPRKALEERIAQFRMQQFNQGIEQAFNRLFPFADMMGRATDGFGRLRGKVDEAGEAFTRAIERIDPRQVSEALNTLGAFFNSQSGAIATLKNNIALLAQQLQLDLPFRKRREVLEDLEAMQSQLAALTRPKPPVIAGTSFGAVPPSIQDPGLAPGAVQIKMEFPNISRITQRDMSEILDAVNLELTRRGSSRFF